MLAHMAPVLSRPAIFLLLASTLIGGSALSLNAQTGDEQPPITDPTAVPTPTRRPSTGPYRAASPEYGMHLFTMGTPDATDRDLGKLNALRFGWQKSMFRWREIQPQRDVFFWDDADALVQASNAAGVKVIARLDSTPSWARSGTGNDGPPNNFADWDAFVFAFVDHYKPDSPYGTVDAVELWNEPNLDREWGGGTIDRPAALRYVNLLCTGYRAAKRANPDVVTISAALSPTGTKNGRAMDDVVYLGWLYEGGMKPCFDVLGAHGVGYKAPPWISPQELATNKQWGGDASFGFRRVEQLRQVMERNGDASKQIWLTEFGWTSDSIHQSYSWHRVSEQDKAEYIVQAFRFAATNWRPWIGVMVLWNMPAPDWTEAREEYWWSITNPDGTTRPAYDRLLRERTSGSLP